MPELYRLFTLQLATSFSKAIRNVKRANWKIVLPPGEEGGLVRDYTHGSALFADKGIVELCKEAGLGEDLNAVDQEKRKELYQQGLKHFLETSVSGEERRTELKGLLEKFHNQGLSYLGRDAIQIAGGDISTQVNLQASDDSDCPANYYIKKDEQGNEDLYCMVAFNCEFSIKSVEMLKQPFPGKIKLIYKFTEEGPKLEEIACSNMVLKTWFMKNFQSYFTSAAVEIKKETEQPLRDAQEKQHYLTEAIKNSTDAANKQQLQQEKFFLGKKIADLIKKRKLAEEKLITDYLNSAEKLAQAEENLQEILGNSQCNAEIKTIAEAIIKEVEELLSMASTNKDLSDLAALLNNTCELVQFSMEKSGQETLVFMMLNLKDQSDTLLKLKAQLRKNALKKLNLDIDCFNNLLLTEKNPELKLQGEGIVKVMRELAIQLESNSELNKFQLGFSLCQQLIGVLNNPQEFISNHYLEFLKELEGITPVACNVFLFAFETVKQRVSDKVDNAVRTKSNQFLPPITNKIKAALAEMERLSGKLSIDKLPLLIQALEIIEIEIGVPAEEQRKRLVEFEVLFKEIFGENNPAPTLKEFIDCMWNYPDFILSRNQLQGLRTNVENEQNPLVVASYKIENLLGNQLIEKLPSSEWDLLKQMLHTVATVIEPQNKLQKFSTIETAFTNSNLIIPKIKEALDTAHKDSALAYQAEVAFHEFLLQAVLSNDQYNALLKNKAQVVLEEVKKLENRVPVVQLPVLSEILQESTKWIIDANQFDAEKLANLVTKADKLTDKADKKIGEKLAIALAIFGAVVFVATCVALAIFAPAIIPVVGFFLTKIAATVSTFFAGVGVSAGISAAAGETAAVLIGAATTSAIPLVMGGIFSKVEKNKRKALGIELKEFGKLVKPNIAQVAENVVIQGRQGTIALQLTKQVEEIKTTFQRLRALPDNERPKEKELDLFFEELVKTVYSHYPLPQGGDDSSPPPGADDLLPKLLETLEKAGVTEDDFQKITQLDDCVQQGNLEIPGIPDEDSGNIIENKKLELAFKGRSFRGYYFDMLVWAMKIMREENRLSKSIAGTPSPTVSAEAVTEPNTNLSPTPSP